MIIQFPQKRERIVKSWSASSKSWGLPVLAIGQRSPLTWPESYFLHAKMVAMKPPLQVSLRIRNNVLRCSPHSQHSGSFIITSTVYNKITCS